MTVLARVTRNSSAVSLLSGNRLLETMEGVGETHGYPNEDRKKEDHRISRVHRAKVGL
jgi:hypothetical protein